MYSSKWPLGRALGASTWLDSDVYVPGLKKKPKPHHLACVSQFAFIEILLTKGEKSIITVPGIQSHGYGWGCWNSSIKKVLFQLPIIEIFQAEIFQV